MMLRELRKLTDVLIAADKQHDHKLCQILGSAIKHIIEIEQRPKLSDKEISLGQNTGRVAAIKAYRDRTASSLLEAIAAVDGHFTRNNLLFNSTC